MICLPKDIVTKFVSSLKSGELDPNKLMQMSSEERRTALEPVVGEDNAKDVNALFEAKMELKDQQNGMISWIKETAGLKPEVQRDIISRVNKMDNLLNPKELKDFKADLVAKKLGVGVTDEEARQLSQLGKDAIEAKKNRDANPGTENNIKYGKAKQAFGDYFNSLKPSPDSGIKNTVINILNIPKSALTSVVHFSAPFVQGWGMVSTGRFWEGTAEMFKYFASEDNYKTAEAAISGHPDYDLAKDAGLGLTSIDGKLNDREEAIQSSLLQKGSKWLSDKTGLPDFIRAASRSFTGFLNYVRFNRFEDLLNAARLSGEDVRKGSEATEQIADTVNNFTGRGKMVFGMDNNQAFWNTLFFSPRKMMATIQMFNPVNYLDPDVSPTARMAALRQLSGSLVVTGSILGLARLGGAEVNVNPISTDFGKIKMGNTSFDMSGGNAAYVKLVSQLITGKETSTSGKTTKLGSTIMTTSKTGKVVKTPYTEADRLTVGENYLRDHLSPIVAVVVDWMAHNTNVVGQPTTVKGEIYNELTPLVLQDWINLYKNDPKNVGAIIPSLSAMFGVAMESNAPIPKKTK